MVKRLIITAFTVFLLIYICCSCNKQENMSVSNISDLYDKEITVGFPSVDGTLTTIEENFPNAETVPYDDLLIGINALRSEKIDAYITGEFFIKRTIVETGVSDVSILDGSLLSYQVGLGLSDTAPIDNYLERVNQCLNELISDGTMEEMKKRWLIDGNDVMPEIILPENPEYTLRIAVYGANIPYSFIKDNELAGLDIEVALRVCQYLGVGAEFTAMEYPAMFMGLSTGKYDLISANLYITDDHKENMTFSIPYSENAIVCAVRSDWVDSDRNTENYNNDDFGFSVNEIKNFIIKGINKTFIAEKRWKLIVSGLETTLIITVLGFINANIVGAVFCNFQFSKKRILNRLYDAFSRIMQGTPTVVVLMILFYIIFGKTSISGVGVAVIGFGLISGASLAQQFYGAVSSVSKGQSEAALSLGFTKIETYIGIVFPQAMRFALPGYFSEFISLLKGTSIAGYIAIMDLTKVSDMIRSSTYDAFFPLLSIALIYFLISYALLKHLKHIQKKLAPKRMTCEEAEE